MTTVELTAIVPTRDRPEALAKCLRALDAERAEMSLDIVVVDDGSAEPQAVERVVAEIPDAVIVPSVRRGIGAARNTGVTAAATEFVAFTDDDGEVQPGWAHTLVTRLREGAVVVGGATVAADGQGSLAVASQLASNALLGAQLAVAPASNLACRRDVALEIPFDESFVDIGGEERDWCARLFAQGHALVREPRAVVVHRQQLTFGAYWRKHVLYGRGAYRFRTAHARGRLEPRRFYAGLVRSAFRQGAVVGLAFCLAEVATAAGFLAEAHAPRA